MALQHLAATIPAVTKVPDNQLNTR